MSRSDDIAIVGMACLFPKAPDLATFWENILGMVDAVTDAPPEWGADLVYDPTATTNDRIYTQRGGFLGDLACFDPLDHGVMPRSIDGGEPEHFLALRVAHDALADAGYLDRPFNRERTAVILGRGTYVNRGYGTVFQYAVAVEQTIRLLRTLHPEHSEEDLAAIKRELHACLPPFNAETAPGLVPSVMCGRIANRLDLMGPAYAVDAACASSLIAIELAMSELQSGKADLVLAGGVQVSTTFPITLVFCQLGALSRRGALRPFGAEADGTLLGEGAGIVVLKRHEDAERDEDRIYAVLKAVGTASDGRAVGVLAPRVEGEELAMLRAYEQAGVSPDTISLLDGHGTGTPVGDAAELEALGRVFGPRGEEGPTCALGSIKSMIGHPIPAAGVAGIIKTALALHHKVLPPTLHGSPANARIAATPFYLSTETRPWIHAGPAPRRAAVSAFGFGGINAHAILEEHDGAAPPRHLHRSFDAEVIVLSAGSREKLIAHGHRVRQSLAGRPDTALLDLAYALNCPPPAAADARLAVVATSIADLDSKLGHALQRLADPACRRIKERSGVYYTSTPLSGPGALGFLFPGEGAQYVNMLADLCIHFPEVRAWFDLMDRAFAQHQRGYRPSQAIFPAPGDEGPTGPSVLWSMDRGTEAVFTANQGLLSLLDQLGIHPDAVVGHSTGEYSALWASSAVRVDDEAALARQVLLLNEVYERLRGEGRIPTGVLLAVGTADREQVLALVRSSEGALTVAMDNCPHQMVICGSSEAAAAASAKLRQSGAVCTTLPFDRAYHTPRFSQFSDQLSDFYAQLDFQSPQVAMYSCVTAARCPDEPEALRRLAADQWARPVRFRETIEAMHADGVRIFVEVGPRGNLTGFVDDILRSRPHLAVPADVSSRSGTTQLSHLIGLLAAHHVPMDLEPLYARRSAGRLPPGNSGTAAEPSGADRSRRIAVELPLLELDRRPRPEATIAPSIGERDMAVGEYLNTMSRFLEVQRQTMRDVLGKAATTEPPAVAMGGGVGTDPPGPSEPASLRSTAETDVAQIVLRTVSERTGYPVDVLDVTASLEADLGLDSIKRVEILGALQHEHHLAGAADLERLARVDTLQQLIDALQAPAAPAQARTGWAETPRPAGPTTIPATPPPAFPLLGSLVSLEEGRELVAARRLDLSEDLFLHDHTLGRRVSVTDSGLLALPVLPLTISMEMLAEAAAALLASQVVVGIKQVRANRWIAVDDGQATLRLRARRIPDGDGREVKVELEQLLDKTATGAGTPVVAGTVVLADSYPTRPPAPLLSLQGERPYTNAATGLYSEGMFHGPRFQGVVSLDRWGQDGTEATLTTLATDELFASASQPTLLTDPLLLDAAGQLIGFWTVEHLDHGFNVFPFALEELQRFGPSPPPGTLVRARAQITLVGEREVRSNIDLIGPDGQLLARMIGWADRRFDPPDPLYRLRISPRMAKLGTSWSKALIALPNPDAFACYRVDQVPVQALTAHGRIWQRVLAQLVLDRRERERWAGLPGSDQRRSEWLLGRAAAKDAVRTFLETASAVQLCPADVHIDQDDQGSLSAGGTWTARLERAPFVSLSHCDGVAVALAGDDGRCRGIGIDLERVGRVEDALEQLPFGPDERGLLAALDGPTRQEWALRLWCAKEAAGKALGCGVEHPTSLTAAELDPDGGRVRLVAGADTVAASRLGTESLTVRSVREGEWIVTLAIW